MGRRKFKLRVPKNYERKKYARKEFVVSIPRSALLCPFAKVLPTTVSNYDSTEAQSVVEANPSELIIQIPISSYTASPVGDASQLHKRLMSSQSLPEGWTSSLLISNCHLPVFSLSFNLPLNSSQLVITVTIKQNCQWLLALNCSEIDLSFCQLLKEYLQSPLNSVHLLLKLLSCLQKCTICTGNSDEKFMPVQQRRNGTFSGKLGINLIT